MNFSHYTLRLAARKMCLDVTEISSSPLFSLSTTYPKWKNKKEPFAFSFFVSGTNRHFVLLRDNNTTTTMPSEEQQLPEPLLDDGGNDRFVLFPLKYDAVWEMVRALVILLFLSCLLLCSKSFEISCELLTLPPLLFSQSNAVQESSSVVLDRWYVLFLLYDWLLSKRRSSSFFSISRENFKNLPFSFSLSPSLSLSFLWDDLEIKQRKSIYKTT